MLGLQLSFSYYRRVFRICLIASVFCGVFLFPQVVAAHAPELHEETIIHMTPNGFEPKEVEVSQGQQVTFVNDDTNIRWPASNIHPTHSQYPGSGIEKCATDAATHVFDACGPLQPGEEYSFVFEETGSWQFHDHVRSEFSGEIVVTEVLGYQPPEYSEADSVPVVRVWWEDFVVHLSKLYYQLFPERETEKLAELDIRDIAFNEPQLRHWMRIFGSEAILNDLIKDVSVDSYTGCHFEAHVIGRMAFALEEVSPLDVFDTRCEFGYYHGLLESFLGKDGTLDTLAETAIQCSTLTTQVERINCYHGIGHGVTVYVNYDLPRALEACDTLATDEQRKYCHRGVFMENGLNATVFTAGKIHQSPWLNESDPYFPCNTLEEHPVWFAHCYGIQPLIMEIQANFDFTEVARMCALAPEAVQLDCYSGRGFFAAAPPQEPDVPHLVALCRNEDTVLETACVTGVIEMITLVWGEVWLEDGNAFCESFSEPVKAECRSVQSYLRQ